MNRRTPNSSSGALLVAMLALVCLSLLKGGQGPFSSVATALMYPVTNTAHPCFIEEVESHTDYITGAYVWHKHQLNAQTKLFLELRTPSQVVLHRLELMPDNDPTSPNDVTDNYQSSMVKVLGHPFSFSLLNIVAKELGPYQLCLSVTPPISGINPAMPILLSIDVDQAATQDIRNQKREAVELKEVIDGAGGEAEKTTPNYLQRVGKSLLDLRRDAEHVASNMESFLGRMDRMQLTGESTFTRVWVMAIITIVVVCLAVFLQFKWLSATIVKRKLV